MVTHIFSIKNRYQLVPHFRNKMFPTPCQNLQRMLLWVHNSQKGDSYGSFFTYTGSRQRP